MQGGAHLPTRGPCLPRDGPRLQVRATVRDQRKVREGITLHRQRRGLPSSQSTDAEFQELRVYVASFLSVGMQHQRCGEQWPVISAGVFLQVPVSSST